VNGYYLLLIEVNDSKAQQWSFTNDGYLVSALKAADGSDIVLGVLVADGSVHADTKHGEPNAQKWTLNAQGNMVSKLKGYFLTFVNNNAETNILYKKGVNLWPPNVLTPQIWLHAPVLRNIKPKLNLQLALNVRDGANKPGTPVQLLTVNGSQAQLWSFTIDGYVVSALKAANGSDLVLDVINSNQTVGAKLQISYKSDTDAQKWTLNQGCLYSKLNNNYVLDVPNAKAESGALVQLWSYNGTDAQKWNIY